ncbi:MAG: 4Fe-4S binding protein [Clostridiales Family XIII bacterium]|jgi:NAD-dependent dihydropyrimidine dehydrogenase PreA subunit|nr:4Fe-4S binding protein [Clostridiales Family XIII bacterium]
MAIKRIDPALCVGCGMCEMCCPADVIRTDNESKRAYVKYSEDCVMCFFCMSECPKNAIVMSPDIVSPIFASWG